MAAKETRLKTSFHAFHYVYNKDFTTRPFSTNGINIFSYINVTAGFHLCVFYHVTLICRPRTEPSTTCTI